MQHNVFDQLPELLRMADVGVPVRQIAAALGVSSAVVYKVLRQHRPGRTRSPRTRTSTVPARARALVAAGVKPGRVAALLGVRRQYVHRAVKKGTS